HPRDLHSFPTRRSSDLASLTVRVRKTSRPFTETPFGNAGSAGWSGGTSTKFFCNASLNVTVRPVGMLHTSKVTNVSPTHDHRKRSEEHTSELQSRSELV